MYIPYFIVIFIMYLPFLTTIFIFISNCYDFKTKTKAMYFLYYVCTEITTRPLSLASNRCLSPYNTFFYYYNYFFVSDNILIMHSRFHSRVRLKLRGGTCTHFLIIQFNYSIFRLYIIMAFELGPIYRRI